MAVSRETRTLPSGFPSMARIAHLSDVHFGAHDPAVVAGAEAWLAEHRPDLVVISGDFTQRARVEQYREAGAFLDRLEAAGLKTLGVPGNHDVPLYDVVCRFARPLHRYRRYIDDELCPWFENDRLAVLGINTARSLTIKDGRINREQMELIRARFRDVPDDRTKVLVTHPPLFAMPIVEEGLSKVVGRHERAIEAVCEAGVHILLAGHFHRSFSGSAREMVKKAGPALFTISRAEPEKLRWKWPASKMWTPASHTASIASLWRPTTLLRPSSTIGIANRGW